MIQQHNCLFTVCVLQFSIQSLKLLTLNNAIEWVLQSLSQMQAVGCGLAALDLAEWKSAKIRTNVMTRTDNIHVFFKMCMLFQGR